MPSEKCLECDVFEHAPKMHCVNSFFGSIYWVSRTVLIQQLAFRNLTVGITKKADALSNYRYLQLKHT